MRQDVPALVGDKPFGELPPLPEVGRADSFQGFGVAIEGLGNAKAQGVEQQVDHKILDEE